MRVMLDRRTALVSLLAALAPRIAMAAERSPRDLNDLARVETYLNTLKTLRAKFVQVAPDGGLSQGTAWLQRPGRMRFQYDPPAPFLLVASHGNLVFNDTYLRQTSNIPLSRTPLGILLADTVRLSGDATVTAVERLPGQLQVGLVRTASPGEGTLTLIFADNPLTLRQWVVLDAQRQETHVTLSEIELGGTFDPKLFEQNTIPNTSPGGGG